MKFDTQVIELLGRNRLIDEILRAGLEVAHPARDRGIDLIAYADHKKDVTKFVARPIQMKAASKRIFGIDRKYNQFPDLIIAFVWPLDETAGEPETYALTQPQVVEIGASVWNTESDSWNNGSFLTSNPSKEIRRILQNYRMNSERWLRLVTAPA